MLTLNNVTFLRGRNIIIENISLSVARGECVVLAGPNGSGKSTLMALVADIIKPSSGVIKRNGKIGYIPQDTSLIEDATVIENLRFFAKLAKSSLPSVNPFSVDLMANKRVSKLSGGMKKQVSIACALIGDPDIILLDEPCSSLDVTFRDEMAALVEKWKKLGKTIVYVGHDPSEFFPFFDRIVFLGKDIKNLTRDRLSSELLDIDKFTAFYKQSIKDNLLHKEKYHENQAQST